MVGLRQLKRDRTRAKIQREALRLFLERGFHGVTVAEVAEAAEVSAMTVFRHFPTKEDLVMSDGYDEVIAERIAAGPSEGPLTRRIGEGLLMGWGELSGEAAELTLARVRLIMDTPALRARLWENQYATGRAIVAALAGEDPFEVEVAAAACLGAVGVALLRWAAEGGRADVRELIETALEVIDR
ncbi:TetR/AcrR family transcriptional regulator [Pseudonocardia acaciae]|uniref:TetR/AcrR family transcriptional regulator n=1 Tax=Pseudonocardia acaciae TaxID=551276 RepID=UPI00048FBD24|nr:TetR/AcrR family transcriptional regulator [Pseudonocardia acaciae]